jgi:hypothetical protein
MSEPEWDFDFMSDGDMPLTDGEDNLQFLIEGELKSESEDDLHSWRNSTSSDNGEEEEDEEVEEEEAEDDSSSSAGYPPAKRLRAWAVSEDDDDDEKEEAPVESWGSGDEEFSGSSAGGSYDADDEGSED